MPTFAAPPHTPPDRTRSVPPGAPYRPPAGPLRIVHLDDSVLVVDKPAGLLTVPGRGADLGDCLLLRLAGFGARLVHRLDRDTSGLVIFARTRAAQRHLGLQFERRRIDKLYLARVAGRVAEAAGVIDLPLRADWPRRPLQMVAPDGKRAETRWRVVRRDTTETRLLLRPLTGRSHQLRVHLRAIGHPILGDPLYGDGDGDGAGSRMMLHAEAIEFHHPVGGARHRFTAPAAF